MNHTDQAITLLNWEVAQMCKVLLQNQMALDMLTAMQGRPECCIYIPDSEHNVSLASQALRTKINTISALGTDSLTSWWNSLGSWRHYTILGVESPPAITLHL